MPRKLLNQELDRLSLDEMKIVSKVPLVVVLDNIRSAHNVGSVFRTADAFLVKQVVLCGFTAQPPNREIHKTALGATESVDWIYVENTLEAVMSLKNEGYTICSVEQVENSMKLNSFQPDTKTKLAFVFGNEVGGVDQNVVDVSDFCIEIPQFGTKHSLNISVCAGIIIYDIWKKLTNY